MDLVRRWVRVRNRLLRLDRYRDPRSYFGPGGLEEAAAVCAEANRDLLGFVRPPREVEARGLCSDATRTRRDGVVVERWSFDSPLPSGVPTNDRVHFRVYRPRRCRTPDRVVLFHHATFGRRWWIWSWYLAELIRRVPVAMMAAPHHYERTAEGRFPGEGTVNSNPARMYEAIRQWCWDHQATVRALHETAGMRTVAETGYSLGAFQALLLAAAGGIDVPIVSLSSTNRYAFGLVHGVIGRGIIDVIRRAGIDDRQLFAWTDALQLERYAPRLRGRPVFYIRGARDWVDPPPSLDRLEAALQPARSLTLSVGHAGLALRRGPVLPEIVRFLEDTGALRPAARSRPPQPVCDEAGLEDRNDTAA